MNAESPARVIWVTDDSSSDYELLSGALAAIGTTLPDATADEPYVIKIAPGIYEETSTVELKDHVDVEGSGQGVTTITCDCSGDISSHVARSATVSAGNITAEIRHVTISTTGSNDYSVGVYTRGNGSFSMLHVTATGSTSGSTGLSYGVYNFESSPTMNNVTATATDGQYNYGVYNDDSSPTMNNVTATATGGTNSYGVFNSASSASMNNVTATGSGSTGESSGVSNFFSSPTMNNVTATATGSDSVGVFNIASSPTMNNVTATATGSDSVGVVNKSASASASVSYPSSPTIRNSSITGGSNSIFNGAGSVAKVADTALDGSVDNNGTFKCFGVYNATTFDTPSACA